MRPRISTAGSTSGLTPAARLALAAFLISMLLLMAWPATAHAAEFRQGDAITIGPSEVIDDDLYVTGGTVKIEGTVDGNVFAFGQTVVIDGTVLGTVFTGAMNVTVSGDVGGTVLAAGQTVDIDASVGRDLGVAGATVALDEKGTVEGDLGVSAATAQLDGPIGRNVVAYGGTVAIGDTVGGDVKAETDKLRIGPAAVIDGSVDYTSQNEAEIASTAKIEGEVTRHEPKKTDADQPPSIASMILAKFISWIRELIGLALFGLILMALFGGFGIRSAKTLQSRLWASLGVGFGVFLVGPPIAATIFFIGIFTGGWWIGMFAGMVWLIAMAVGYQIGALCTGRWVIQRFNQTEVHPIPAVLLGVFLFAFVSLIPILGAIVQFFVAIFGVGAGILAIIQPDRVEGKPAAEVPAAAPPAAPPVAPPAQAPTTEAPPEDAG